MKVLILGGTGMLGHKLVQVLGGKFEVATTIRGDFDRFGNLGIFDRQNTFDNIDVLNFKKLSKVIKLYQPSVIINAVGVIKQKKEAEDTVQTLQINSVFPHQMANLAGETGARFITLSTDCVFDGKKGDYEENDKANAEDLYGKSKHLGEVLKKNCLTIRTSIIGRELASKNSLVEWFLNTDESTIKGFVNAIYTGFPTVTLSNIISDIIENKQDLEGLYHISSDPINKFDLLTLIKEKLRLKIVIEKYSEFQIDRSLNSDKFRVETGFIPPTWEQLIDEMLDDPTPYKEWKRKIS